MPAWLARLDAAELLHEGSPLPAAVMQARASRTNRPAWQFDRPLRCDEFAAAYVAKGSKGCVHRFRVQSFGRRRQRRADGDPVRPLDSAAKCAGTPGSVEFLSGAIAGPDDRWPGAIGTRRRSSEQGHRLQKSETVVTHRVQFHC